MEHARHHAPPAAGGSRDTRGGTRARSGAAGGTREWHTSIARGDEPAAADAALALDAVTVTKLAAGYEGIDIEPVREPMDDAADHLDLPRASTPRAPTASIGPAMILLGMVRCPHTHSAKLSNWARHKATYSVRFGWWTETWISAQRSARRVASISHPGTVTATPPAMRLR